MWPESDEMCFVITVVATEHIYSDRGSVHWLIMSTKTCKEL